MLVTEPRRYGTLYGTVVAERRLADREREYAVILDWPMTDGTCVVMPIPASRLVVIP
jgi:hypothetical protein